MPPFLMQGSDIRPRDIFDLIVHNPHPTDVLLDTSVFSLDRIDLARQLVLTFSPILVKPVLSELEDLKSKPRLAPLRDIVFPGGDLHYRFSTDTRRVVSAYPRLFSKYVNLLRWRRDAINIAVRRVTKETGHAPTGNDRAKLIRTLPSRGLSDQAIKLANKPYRPDRAADEVLAVFAVLSPIITGRDCYLLTADQDVVDQAMRMVTLLFEDYGAYLMAKDFRNDDSRYNHRHSHESSLFVGDATAIGRPPNPDYLLPPPALVKTCATTVIDVGRLSTFTWISARNMEPAISFQDQDPLGRKGDPGDGNSIIFTLPTWQPKKERCPERYHFGIGKPSLLKVSSDELGPIPSFELLRSMLGFNDRDWRRPKVVSPFTDHQNRLIRRLPR